MARQVPARRASYDAAVSTPLRPSIRQLEYLVALSETLNFRRAAEACFVSQPALSAQIRQLEEQLGVRLFERDRRRVIPTAAASSVALNPAT